VYPLLAIFGGSRCKASLVAWLMWVVLLSAWCRVCIVEPFGVVSAVLASSSMKQIHLPGCILENLAQPFLDGHIIEVQGVQSAAPDQLR
jgi:hypothetical protein